MARAKNTNRAQARRRHREEARTNQLAESATANELAADDSETGSATQPASSSSLRGMFRMPDWRRDLRDLPDILLHTKKLWIPFAALLAAFVAALLLDRGLFPEGLGNIMALFVQLTLPPTALFVFFIGGFLAPRASYLVGAVLGLVDGILWSALFLLSPNAQPEASGRLVQPSDFVAIMLVAIVVGMLAAGFAAWYRNFLRQSQERARQNRAAREQQARAKAKDDARKERDAQRQAAAAARQAKTTTTK